MQQEEELVWTMEGNITSVFQLFDFAQIQKATCNFSEENKLGQGGFGPVYKVYILTVIIGAIVVVKFCSIQNYTFEYMV